MKDDALNGFKFFKTQAENQLNKKIKQFRFGRDGEHFSNEFDLFYMEHGIIRERTLSYSLQLNRVAERKNHTLSDLVNVMLETDGLSKAWWGRLY
jgi:hypothetical protein